MGHPPNVPISRDQFDQGRTPASWEDSIRTFLNSHPTEAFGVLELAKAIQFPVGPIVGMYSLHATLHRMAAQGKIEERIVQLRQEERHVLCDDGLIGSPPISGQGPILVRTICLEIEPL